LESVFEVERRIAEARRCFAPLVRHNYGSQPEGGLLFEIDATSATLDGSPENYLNQDDLATGKTGKKRRH